MDLSDALNFLENRSVAQEVLYGNSPKDMVKRASYNSVLRSLVLYFKANPLNVEFVITNLQRKLNSEPENGIYLLGQIICYFEVLKYFPSKRVINLFEKSIAEFGQDSLLGQALSDQFLHIQKDISFVSIPRHGSLKTDTVMTSVGAFKININ